MSNLFATNWTKKEFKAYVLLYAAHANFFETEEEKEIILSLVDPLLYKEIHRELDRDNDYQSIQKILYNFEKYNYSKESLHLLIEDIELVFDADRHHDVLEDNFLIGLKKLLK
jgi:hypothetical protein